MKRNGLRLMAIIGVLALMMPGQPVYADAVTKFYSAKIKLYENSTGKGKTMVIPRDDVYVPAAVLSRRTPKGLIMVRFEFADGKRESVTGWVRYSSVSIDKNETIKVPGCASPSDNAQVVHRGVRGLGKGCR